MPSDKPKSSWRDVLPIHPAAEFFPVMSADELKALGENIKKHGLKIPVTVWLGEGEPLQLLDGRNRLDAMEAVGIPIKRLGKYFIEYYREALMMWEPAAQCIDSDIDPYDFVLSANIHRRHLTAELKRELIAKVLKAQPQKSNRQIGEQIKASHHTVGKVRAELQATGHVAQLTKTVGKDGKARKPPKKNQQGRADLLRRRTTTHQEEENLLDQIDRENPQNFLTAFLLRVDQATTMAKDAKTLVPSIFNETKPKNDKLVVMLQMSRHAGELWEGIAQELETKGVRDGLADKHRLVMEKAAAPPAAPAQPSAPDFRAEMGTEEYALKRFKGRVNLERNYPLPKGMMVDSGNGPEPVGALRLEKIREEWRENYQRAWDKLSPAEQEILADYVSGSGIGTTAPAQRRNGKVLSS
jgi:hypothetical protein